jgi:CheY-like chemotaxis protein
LAPEILIVGDRSQRGSLIPRVQDLGYTVTPVRERELGERVAAAPVATAVLICLGETDAATLVDAARNGRDDVPLILVGSLGGELRDLADVLELGADHFLAAPVSDEELARVLADVVGPGAPGRGEDDGEAPETVRPLTGRGVGDPVLGQLHRTLEILAARLKSHESGDAEPDDLESLGLHALPDVDQGIDTPDGEALLANAEPSDPGTLRRPEPTQRLVHARAVEPGDDTQRLRRPVVADRSMAEASSEARVMAAAAHGERSDATPAIRPSGRVDATDRLSARASEPRPRSGPGETTARVLAPRLERVLESRRAGAQGGESRSEGTGRVIVPRGDGRRDASETTTRLQTPRADVGRARIDLSHAEPLVGVEVLRRLWQLHKRGFTGRLVVGFAGGVVKQVWWRRGLPVYAASTAAGDGLLVRLQARGLLGRGQQVAAARVIDGELAASARRLVQAGLLKPREQQEAVRDAVQRICESLCSDAAERWQTDVGHGTAPAEIDVGTPLLAMLVAGTRLGLGLARMQESLAESTRLRVDVEELEELADELRWPAAAGWLELLDGSRALGLLVAEDGLDERELWAASCVLLAAGLAAPAELDAEAALVEIDRRRIDERLALARDSDYFSLLGVGREAGRAELLRAYADLRDTFADEQLEPRTREELAELLAELHAALEEAREVLLDEALREAYLAQLSGV